MKRQCHFKYIVYYCHRLLNTETMHTSVNVNRQWRRYHNNRIITIVKTTLVLLLLLLLLLLLMWIVIINRSIPRYFYPKTNCSLTLKALNTYSDKFILVFLLSDLNSSISLNMFGLLL